MFRSESLSASWNTYFPAPNVLPGICTGALNWNSVFLFHSSARTGCATNERKRKKPGKAKGCQFHVHCISPMIFCQLRLDSRLSQDAETALHLVPGGAVRREEWSCR